MANLSDRNPKIANEFDAGHFPAQKTSRLFSAIALNQAHEQVNACIKGDGGAVGLTDDPNALRRWMVAGPEVARAIREFQDAMEPVHRDNTEEPLESKHHEENESWQKLFVKDVCSLTSSIEELGNPFEEDSKELLTLDTNQIADISVMETVRSAYKIGKDKFDLFVKEQVMERKVSVDKVLSRNKLILFTTKHLSEKQGKQQLMLMKSDMQLFSRLYVACQTLDGNLDEFFRHEKQSCPPSLSNMGNLRLGGRSDLLPCLENLSAVKPEAPAVTVLPELTEALLSLSFMPHSIPEETMKIIERFVILMYDKTSRCTDIDKARRKMFAKRLKAEQIPPTFHVLELHLRRAIYQGGYVWAHALLTQPVLPSPTGWGWTKDNNGVYVPKWTCLLLPKRVMSYYIVDAKKDAEKTADAKELIWNVQAYATVKDVMGNAFESRLAR